MNDARDEPLEHVIRIAARPETVWRFLVEQERLLEWWGRAQIDLRPGGALTVHMLDGPRPVMQGEIVEVSPPQRLVFTFGWAGTPRAPAIPPGSSRVEITLTPDGTGTILRLRHFDLPRHLGGETLGGWEHLLTRLALSVMPAAASNDGAGGPHESPSRRRPE